MSELDLNQLVKKGTIEVGSEEHADERAVRLRREERRDLREHILFFVVLGSLIVVAAIAAYAALLDTDADPETRKFAQTALAGIISGGAGFLFGRAIGRQ